MMALVDQNRTDKGVMHCSGHSYIPSYEKLLHGLQNSAKCVGEIGVQRGGSIKLWHDYFPNAKIVGIDIMPKEECYPDLLEMKRVELFLEADAYNHDFVAQKIKPNFQFDVLVDDGSHRLEDMQTFIRLYLPLMSPTTGVMIVEDVQQIEWIQKLRLVVPQRYQHCIEVIDLREQTGRWDDLCFVIDLRKTLLPAIIVPGCGGLGNCLYQIASAAHYSFKHNREIVLHSKSPNLQFGTALLGRDKAVKDADGNPVPYAKTIFKKFRFVDEIPADAQVFSNSYGADYDEWRQPDAQSLLVTGYNQHRDMLNFAKNSAAWLSVDEKSFLTLLTTKYAGGDVKNFRNCVIVCIRRGEDFKNMKQLTNKFYNACLQKHFAADATFLIVSDCSTLLETIAPVTPEDECLLENTPHEKVVFVNEPDIVQFHLSRLCKNIVVSESTFHAFMAYFVGMTFSQPRIVFFKDTDVTRRNLNLANWIVE